MLAWGMCAFSCTKENQDPIPGYEKTPKYVPAAIVLPTNHLEWDESYHPNDGVTRANNHSDQMAVTSSNIFLGAVYTAQSIEDLTLNWIPNQLDPIDVSYTFPRYYFDEIQRPSISAMYRSLSDAINSPQFSGKQSLSFEYDLRQFEYYRELKLAFGANVNIAGIFKLDASVNSTKIESKSALFARVVQKNFSMIMDYPYDGNIFLNNSDLSTLHSRTPVYINSIIFGRMGIIAIESDYSYNELKMAFKAALTAAIINGELNIGSQDKKILQESTMRLLVSGGIGQDVAKIVEGYHEFSNFIVNCVYKPLIYPRTPITISLTLPGTSPQQIHPASYSKYLAYIQEQTTKGTFVQNGEFNFTTEQFTSYNELKVAFGSNVNTNGLFWGSSTSSSSSDHLINKATGLYVKFYQTSFKAIMDYPRDKIALVPTDMIDSAVYINSITYGRLGLLTLETNESVYEAQDKINQIFKTLFYSNSSTFTKEEQSFLNGCEFKVYLIGGNGNTSVESFSGLDGFIQHIKKGSFSRNVPGTPIFCTFNHVKDNSPVKVQFKFSVKKEPLYIELVHKPTTIPDFGRPSGSNNGKGFSPYYYCTAIKAGENCM